MNNDNSQITVLAVEDDPLQRIVLEGLLDAIGVKVVSAASGEEGLAALLDEAQPIDLVLTDIQMPGMTGIEMTRRFRASAHPRSQELPIIAITIESDDAIRAEAIAAGVTSLTRKPVSEGILRAYLELFAKASNTDAMYVHTLRRKAGEAKVLAEAATVRNEFRARISHALRTPLNVMRGLLEEMNAGELDEAKRRRYLDYFGEALRDLEGKVDAILGHDGNHEEKAVTPGQPPRADKPIEALRVLVVDDILLNRRILGIHLQKLGVKEIEFAENGADALEVLAARPIDVVLTDICMPVMNGAELAAKMRDNPKFARIPSVAITAEVNCSDSYDLSPFSAVLIKPVGRGNISKVLKDLGVH